jgi:hypothetical protein
MEAYELCHRKDSDENAGGWLHIEVGRLSSLSPTFLIHTEKWWQCLIRG